MLYYIYIIHYLIFLYLYHLLFFFFFFQAEDGIRDVAVTGVQTCALPIYARIDQPVGDHPDRTVFRNPKKYAGREQHFRSSLFGAQLPILFDVRKIADRKSTRLNSSHGYISYAVFCLKKKNKKNNHMMSS